MSAIDSLLGGAGYSKTLLPFTQPAVGGSVFVQLINNAWLPVGERVLIEGAGTYLVSSKDAIGCNLLAISLVIAGGNPVSAGRIMLVIGPTLPDSSSSQGAIHQQVRLATAAALPAYTRTGDTITANANGTLTAIDGPSPSVGNRILLKNGAASSDNGIYQILSLGSGGSAWSMIRAADMATGTVPLCMAIGGIEEGSTNGGKQWKLTTANPIALNTTGLTFVVF